MEDNVEKSWKYIAHAYCENTTKKPEDNEFQVRFISDALRRGETGFVEVIEELGLILSGSNVALRQRGMKLFVELLRSLPKDFLNLNEVDSVTHFLIFRLQDHHTIVPNALQGLLALSQYAELPKGFARNVITAIFKEIHVPSQLQCDRYAVYQMILLFLQTHLEELKHLESMVLGFIQILDGEREPRCLMIAFNIVPEIVRHFDLGPYAEEFFEVLACYFPIDFNPREDHSTISRKDLAAALHKCLIASPKFANFCIKLLLEKWDDGNEASRLDIYHVLETSCSVFEKMEYEEFWSALWNIIRKDLYMRPNADVEAAVLSCLTTLVRTMYEGDSNKVKEDFLEEVLGECRQHICQPEPGLVPCIAKILEAVSLSSGAAATKTLSYIIPHILEQYPLQTQVAQKRNIVEILVKLLSAIKQHETDMGRKPLGKHSDEVLALLFSLLDSTEKELCNLSLTAFSEALSVNCLLDDSHRELLAHHLVHLLLSSSVVERAVRLPSQHFLGQLSKSYPFVTQNHIMPILKKSLSEYKPGDKQELRRILDAMTAASSHSTIIMDVLTTTISFLSNQMHGPSAMTDAQMTARSLLTLANHCIPLVSLPENFLIFNVIQPLFVLCLNLSSLEQPLDEDRFKSIELVSEVIQKLVQSLNPSSVIPYLTSLTELILHGMVPNMPDLKISSLQTNKNNSSPFHEAIPLLLLQTFLTGMNMKCSLPNESILLEYLVNTGIESKNPIISNLASHSAAVIVNKRGHEPKFSSLLTSLFTKMIKHCEESGDCAVAESQNSLSLWIWITKALVLAGHPKMSTYTKQLILWLQSDLLGKNTAEGFSTIVEESRKVFNTEGHACIKLLFRQRFFIETRPSLFKGYSESPKEYKSNYLVALCSQLKYLRKTILMSELPSILPMLLHALNDCQNELQLHVLVCLEVLLKEDPSLFKDHLNTLIPRLLELACGSDSMKIKIYSLSCLESLCPIPNNHLLFPLKHQVIRSLKTCLDDRKRLVRKAAVQASCQWHMIGEQGK